MANAKIVSMITHARRRAQSTAAADTKKLSTEMLVTDAIQQRQITQLRRDVDELQESRATPK